MAEARRVLKNPREVARIRKSCRLAVETLLALRGEIHAGVSTLELDRVVRDFLRARGAEPAIPEGFPGAACFSVNEVAAHGCPSDYRLREGDLLSVDVSLSFHGWCGDAAWSFPIGRCRAEVYRLLEAALRATLAGLAAARPGGNLGDIGAAVMRTAGQAGCRVIEECRGHGLGQRLHEGPEVPNLGEEGSGAILVPGTVITVEPVLCLGSGAVEPDPAGWGLLTADRTPTAHFEYALAILWDRAAVLAPMEALSAELEGILAARLLSP